MEYIELSKWIERMIAETTDPEKRNKLEQAKLFFDSGLQKLAEVGIPEINPVLRYSSTMGGLAMTTSHLSLSNTEATRLLMVAKFLSDFGKQPTSRDLALYKKSEITIHDAANESRILNSLEDKGFIERELVSNKNIDDLHISLTDVGREAANSIAHDLGFLRKMYNRSRNNRIKEFLLKFIELNQSGQPMFEF